MEQFERMVVALERIANYLQAIAYDKVEYKPEYPKQDNTPTETTTMKWNIDECPF